MLLALALHTRVLPMRFYISRVLECFLCCQALVFFLVQFFASLPIPPNISPVSCLFCSTCFFQPVLQWIKEGRTWYLIFFITVWSSEQSGKKSRKTKKNKKNRKGRQRRRKEENGLGGGRKVNINHVVKSIMYCSLERSGERGVRDYLVLV